VRFLPTHLAQAIGDCPNFLRDLETIVKNYTNLPNYIWHNIGLCHQELGRHENAIDFYLKAMSVKDDYRIHWNLSMCYLMMGNYLEGFRQFEYRLWSCGKNPGWQGEDIREKTLIVLPDGGLGDTIQFLRYVPLLQNYGCKVFVDIQPELHCLFGDFLSANPNSIQESEMVYVDMMSLPYCFRTELHTIPPPAKIKCCLSPKKGVVGVVWRGSRESLYDKRRSIPLSQFATLFSLPGINYICLQKEVSEEEERILAHYEVKRPPINSFLDTVEQIEKCEYVISVCSSVAHLSGSMGVPTLIPLAFNHCWRWLKDRIDSPWYPSVRLFRQKRHEDWSEPLKEIQQFLTKKP
jgi:tetratricopeptide (TPR) repeat protein